jgi:hypothetical protein
LLLLFVQVEAALTAVPFTQEEAAVQFALEVTADAPFTQAEAVPQLDFDALFDVPDTVFAAEVLLQADVPEQRAA